MSAWAHLGAALRRDWRDGMTSLRELVGSRPVREALRLCVPALVVGFALRVAFVVAAPYGYFLSDTRNFIDPAGSSRTFFAAALYLIPVAMGAPVLKVVPWIQHAMGLWMIAAAGLLCAACLRRWRWWIVPLTLIVAAHPSILWYEHMALPESMFVVLTLTTGLAFALFLKIPSPPTFLILWGSIFLTAGARQEGFLYALAALAGCALAFRHDRRRMASYLGATFLFLFLTTRASHTAQGGQMLISSLIQYAPDRLWSAPDYSSRAMALRDKFKPLWPIYPEDHNETRDIIVQDVGGFLTEERGLSQEEQKRANNAFCRRVAIEIALRNFWVLPKIAYYKWRATHIEAPAPVFDGDWMRDYALRKAFGSDRSKERKFLPALYGRSYASADSFDHDLREIYYRNSLGWLDAWRASFVRWSLWPHDQTTIGEGGIPGMPQKLPRLPWLYPLAMAGLVGALFVVDRQRRTTLIMWLAMLIFVGFIVAVTGSLRSRYRLAFEPYWYIGLMALCELTVAWIRMLRPRFGRRGPP